MLISRNWLQSYFENELPPTDTIAETLLLHAFEIEGIEEDIIDIDVLPNRAHDCLSHYGIAKEYATLTHQGIIENRYHYREGIHHDQSRVNIRLENPHQCHRYLARKIEHVVVGGSPDWLRTRLESIGQRSVNNIVDATNYVMFDLGQPIHAFDADKVVGKIIIRNAKVDETMTTLNGEEIVLTDSDLVIADEEGILALAGVKGGVKAEVTHTTRNIIIEVANFNPLTTRQTARRVKILTDSSKRFENAISSEIAPIALESVSRLISNIAHGDSCTLSEINDTYPDPETPRTVRVVLFHVQSLLGIKLSSDDMVTIFERLGYQYHLNHDEFEVHIPHDRLDLVIPEDLIEEIGRIYGYYNIKSRDLSDYDFTPELNQQVYLQNKLRNLLTERGFSEVMTYSFTKKGDVAVKNPIASDKAGLRKNLHKGVQTALELNARNQDFFGGDRTAIFEIGRVYTKDGEKNACAIAVQNAGKVVNKKYGTERDQLEVVIEKLSGELGVELDVEYHGQVVTFYLDKLEVQPSYEKLFDQRTYSESDSFKSISPYPFTKRDISFWAPEGKGEGDLHQVIAESGAGYLQKVFLFDQFEKDGRVSYAFSMVFQSHEKTLTDVEVDGDMEKIQGVLIDLGAEIR